MNKTTTQGIIWLVILSPIAIPTIIVTVFVKIVYRFAVATWDMI